MKGDFSRLTFDPSKQYSAVLTQQGRVSVDADANEQQAINVHRVRRTSADVIGPAGAPQAEAGFDIGIDAGRLTIGAGTYYVDGIRCRNETPATHDRQPNLPAGTAIFMQPGGNPATSPVDGRYLAYLDVWSRHITALEDSSIRESAIGVDTTTRLKTIWQLRCLRIGNAGAAALTCDAALPPFDAFIAPPTGTLAARAKAAAPQDNPCLMPENAGYQRLDNHLYRVEIHRSGPAGGTATFKWSRDNASLATPWLASDHEVLTVSSSGRDQYTGFRNGQWIELSDDDRELRGEPGVLVRIKSVKGTAITIDATTADGPIDIANFNARANPKIRGWDSAGALSVTVPADNDGFTPIESGLEIAFSAGGTYRAGDYWLIPARSAIGVEWPKAGGLPQPQAPRGIAHVYAKLAILDFAAGTWTKIGDCRQLFPPLSGLTSLFYLGGDGQEAMPDSTNPATLVALDAPLQVGVARGTTPVEKARVRFRVTAGNGRLTGNVAERIVDTNASGLASTGWWVDSGTAVQAVTATLLDSDVHQKHLALTFSAALRRADRVSFNPANTPEISATKNVQAAIEALYGRSGQGACATYVLSPSSDWVKVLQAIPKGQEATICFRDGDFQAAAPVVISGLGHVVVHGGGDATRISVPRSEIALSFVDCASVRLSALAIAATDTAGEWGPVAHLNGALTITDCPIVEVSGATLSCGASLRNERTCITVRSTPVKGGKLPPPLKSVRITGNRLVAGYGQTGILVVDALSAVVRDNELGVAARPNSMSFERLLTDPKRRALLARRLVGAVKKSSALLGKGEHIVARVGDFMVTIPSSATPAEWQAFLKTTPPSETEKATAEGVKTYVNRMIDTALQDPTKIKSYGRQIDGLKKTLGDEAFKQLPSQVKRSLLVTDAIDVIDLRQAGRLKTNTVLIIGDTSIGFNSPVNQSDWTSILRLAPPAKPVLNESDSVKYVRDTARRLVKDDAFRSRFASAKAWFDALKADNPTVGYQGIVCAGSAAREVDVSNNLITAFREGIRVAVSHRAAKGQFDQMKNVTVMENTIYLRLPAEYERERCGLLVGSAERIRIIGNTLSWAAPRVGESRYDNGIRVWGHLGPMIIVRENLVSVDAGILVVQEDPPQPRGRTQWLAANNMVSNVAPANVVQAPPQFMLRENTPA